MTITEVKNHIAGMMHGATVNRIRNFYHACERAHNTVRSKIKPVELIRVATLSQTIHDALDTYSAPSDFGEVIDLAPQAGRTTADKSSRNLAEVFAAERSIKNRIISIEGREGTKVLNINWKHTNPVVFHSMNSLTANGTWAVVATASGLALDKLIKFSGSGAIRVDIAANGDGIQITNAGQINQTDEDEISEIIFAVYVPDVTNLTGFTALWGNDLTTNYWTGVAQTAQADGTAWRNGWNIVKIPWDTATETGTVAPATIDSLRITVQATGAIANLRFDNILFSLGSSFFIKYFSKYGFQNSSGVYIQRPTTDDDTVVYDETGLLIFILELAKASAQQMEGGDAVFDLNYINNELGSPILGTGLYGDFLSEYPNQSKKAVQRWSSGPHFRN